MMHKTRTFVFKIVLRLPRIGLILSLLLFLTIPILIVGGLVRNWVRIDKKELLLAIQETFRPAETYLYLAGFIVLVGFVFFAFKNYQQFWYGLLETLVALAGCIISAQTIRSGIYQTNSPNTILLQIFGAIYLLVRGLSNMNDGFKKYFWFKEEYEAFKKAYTIFAQKEKAYLKAIKEGKFFDKDGRVIPIKEPTK